MQSAKNTKNHYQVLGVLDEADDLVIRAAYVALMQRYDLAKWQGNKQVANRKLSELNDAYAVLSGRAERIEYDQTIAKEKNKYEPPISEPADLTPDEADKDWKIACDYYQDLEVLHSNLKKLSDQLAFTFKLSVLQSKDYGGRNQLAARLEHEYLKRYFGNDQDLIDFGRELIIEGQKDAAAELNEVFRVLGSAISADEAIDRIAERYRTARYFKQAEERELKRAELLAKNIQQGEGLTSPLLEDGGSSGAFKLIVYSAVAIIFAMLLFLAASNGVVNTKPTSTSETLLPSNNAELAPIANGNFRNISLGEFKGLGDGSSISLTISNHDGNYFAHLGTAASPGLLTPAGTEVHCAGGVDGKIITSSSSENIFFLKKKLYEDSLNSEYCTIKITRLIHADGYAVDEDNCSMYHGMRCSFTSPYLARK